MQDAEVNAYLWRAGDAGGGMSKVASTPANYGPARPGHALLLALRERGLPLPAGAVLMCPSVDLAGRTQRPRAGFPAGLL